MEVLHTANVLDVVVAQDEVTSQNWKIFNYGGFKLWQQIMFLF
jgi:hypothetical protein